MAVILQTTCQKKLGLPNYSSHSCAVSLAVEIPDVSVAAQEFTKHHGAAHKDSRNSSKSLAVSKPGAHCIVGTNGSHLFSANSFALSLKETLVVPNHSSENSTQPAMVRSR